MFGRLFPSERAAQPSELPTPPARWRGWSRRRMSEPMWKEGASEALIRAITISVCLSPAVRHPATSPHPHCTLPIPVAPSPSVFLRHITANLHSPTHFPSSQRQDSVWLEQPSQVELRKLLQALFQNSCELVKVQTSAIIYSINKTEIDEKELAGGGKNILHNFHFPWANTKPNLVFHLLLGTVLRLLKLMNSGEKNSNCRLFFIFLKPF